MAPSATSFLSTPDVALSRARLSRLLTRVSGDKIEVHLTTGDDRLVEVRTWPVSDATLVAVLDEIADFIARDGLWVTIIH